MAFEGLSDKLAASFKKLRSKGEICTRKFG